MIQVFATPKKVGTLPAGNGSDEVKQTKPMK